MTGTPGTSPARAVSVLVIDDDDDIRESLSDVLEEMGYTVATATDGEDALAQLRLVRPRLILLDLNMPVMSGGEFLAAQRLDPALRRIPTIIMTAVDRMPDRAEDLAAEDILPKPFQLPDLLALLSLYLGGTG